MSAQPATTTNNYRATLILDLRGVTDSVETVTARLKETLASVGANVTREESLGQKAFVRVTDRKNPAGIYIQFYFDGPGTTPAAFREKLRLDRTVKRLLVQSA
ncbi:MAG: 30S ribosomal protein S6 [Puniceicoccales bacterium]|jgi:small subunit ribosomal protein S6|nr:30S ribosomal protein S6 [Puniceicoccales bacterium]